CMQPLQTSFTF
nr:immunoglobulin light chain junction region [Macaca mulatta]